MNNKIDNEATKVSIDKMIYHGISEIRCSPSKRPDENIYLSLLKKLRHWII